jgi:hypothetical protein
MARVLSISNHPYGDRMRTKGTEYDADDADVELLISLRRVIPVADINRDLAYSTRELRAAASAERAIPAPTNKRRTSAASQSPPAAPPPPSDSER